MAQTAEPLIRIEGVEKVYRRDQIGIPVLMGIHLDIPDGEYVALMGPPASGAAPRVPAKPPRPTLCAGIAHRAPGRISVGGRDIATLSQSGLASWRSNTIG